MLQVRPSVLGVLVLASAVGARATPPGAVAEGFGPGDQALHIGALEFQPQTPSVPYTIDDLGDGYLHPIGTANGVWSAPLRLPAGAEIFGICLYAYDANPSTGLNLNLFLSRLAYGGQAGDSEFIAGGVVQTDWDFGYGVSCTPQFSHIFRDTQDYDGDGFADHVAYRLRVVIGAGTDGSNLGLGGVRVFWRRKPSPAPAAASFNDVPTGHPFFQFVEALAASGITAGCGNGNFCPNTAVTRGQLAVFLTKALGLHWPY